MLSGKMLASGIHVDLQRTHKHEEYRERLCLFCVAPPSPLSSPRGPRHPPSPPRSQLKQKTFKSQLLNTFFNCFFKLQLTIRK